MIGRFSATIIKIIAIIIVIFIAYLILKNSIPLDFITNPKKDTATENLQTTITHDTQNSQSEEKTNTSNTIINRSNIQKTEKKESIINREGIDKDYVKEENDKIYVKVNDEWLNSEYLSWDLLKPSYINYNGTSIYVGENALISTLKVLNSLGII